MVVKYYSFRSCLTTHNHSHKIATFFIHVAFQSHNVLASSNWSICLPRLIYPDMRRIHTLMSWCRNVCNAHMKRATRYHISFLLHKQNGSLYTKIQNQIAPTTCPHVPTTGAGKWMLLVRLNTLRPRQNGRRFADDIFKPIFLNENVRISIKISLKFVPKGPINNIPALVQIMAWRRSGDKPLSEPMLVRLLTHICVTRPQWVKRRKWQTNAILTSVKEQMDRKKQHWILGNNN